MNALTSFNLLSAADLAKFLEKTSYAGVTEGVITKGAAAGSAEAIARKKLMDEYHLDESALGLKTTAGYKYVISIPSMNKDGKYKVQIKVTATVNIGTGTSAVATKLTESIAPTDIDYVAHGIDYRNLVKKVEEAIAGINGVSKPLSIHSESGASVTAVTYTPGVLVGNTEFTKALAEQLGLDSMVGVAPIPY